MKFTFIIFILPGSSKIIMNIFKESRIKLNELYQDSINFISNTYGNVGQYFSMASPMGQLLQNVLNYGRMILFYIEDSITELNILSLTETHHRQKLQRNLKGMA